MRCLSLASALQKAGHVCTFACSDDASTLLDLIPYELISLPASLKSVVTEEIWEQEGQEKDFILLSDVLQSEEYDWIVVDHYALDETWERLARRIAKRVLVIDDLANRPHACDILLDQNEYQHQVRRYSGLIPKTAQTLLGGQFAILRDEFREARSKVGTINDTVQNILILMGGADYTGLTLRLIQTLSPMLEQMNIHCDIVVGGLNKFSEEINSFAGLRPYFSVHSGHTRISSLMLGADIAFGAGGTATWELACLGVPMILIPFADNQIEIVRDAVHAGFAVSPGFNDDITERNIIETFETLIDNKNLRQSMRNTACAVIDGNGAMRIVSAMETNGKE